MPSASSIRWWLQQEGVTYAAVTRHLNVLGHDVYFNVVDAALEGRIGDMLLQLEEVVAAGFDAHHFVTGLGQHLRNLLVCKDEATLSLMEAGATVADRFDEQARRCSLHFRPPSAMPTGRPAVSGIPTSKAAGRIDYARRLPGSIRCRGAKKNELIPILGWEVEAALSAPVPVARDATPAVPSNAGPAPVLHRRLLSS